MLFTKKIDYKDYILKITPRRGAVRFLDIERTRLEFEVGVVSRYIHRGVRISLASLWNRESRYVMEFRESGILLTAQTVNGQRDSFLLNGCECLEAFVTAYDRVEIHGNYMILMPRQQYRELPWKCFYRGEFYRNIFVSGESGVGKLYTIEHTWKKNRDFITFTLTAMNRGQCEELLFGRMVSLGGEFYEEGILVQRKKKILVIRNFEQYPLSAQSRLLHFLQTTEVLPVGSHDGVCIETQIVFSSHLSLDQLLEQNKILKELYCFLRDFAFVYEVLPLRQQKRIIRIICDEFMEKYQCKIAPDLIKLYEQFGWPGNIAQLLSHLEKKRGCCSGDLLEYDEFDELLLGGPCYIANEYILTVKEMRRRYIRHIFYMNKRNIKQTLKQLEISYPTLKANLP